MTDVTSAPPTSSHAGKTGAQILNDILIEQGVTHLFGYPGGAVLPFFDVLYSSEINFILSRHEQGAIHMADGYARSTGEVGCVLATSGPGATNIVTGLATAMMDSIPMVAITGQVKSHLIGNDAFQEADVTGITRPVCKHNYLCKDVNDLGRMVREAFYIASSGRPGPVLIDIPSDVTTAIPDGEPNLEFNLPGYKPRGGQGNDRQVKLACEAINAAERPVLYVGGGVILSGASEELQAVAHKGKLPVTTTLMALGAFDETDDLSLRMLGMHGTAFANFAVQEADVLVSVGARFDDRVTGDLSRFAPKAKIIHIDIDPASISKTVKVDIPLVGDAKAILTQMIEHIESPDRAPWLKQIADWKTEYPMAYATEGNIRPQEVIAMLGEKTDHDAIIATGVGQHQMWAAQFYGWKRPRQMLTSGGLGTMGYGVPAAIGAQFANPDKLVVDIDGDGSFSMTMVEVITAVGYKMPTKFIVLDNDYLGMVRQWQEMFYGHRYSGVTHPCPDFSSIAKAFGAESIQVTEREDLSAAMDKMIASEGTFVLHVCVEKEENVYPMVAAGKALHEIIMPELI
ncbi:MAG: biosynthetic-type acetolactate synthase large subunit [Phycisphaerales bacterium]|jgi:acetolactate synthase I/II/III large subunit|nr:biosynthetic-type acetolactate synthase large subunit [Phycisphaerales bacterium]MBT7171680.1 biosynthetic-type acetolactate synthase large subunit [Phycisphaerales bacterium]